jgi:hypothetical protein
MQKAPGAAAGPHVRTSLSSSKAYTLDQWVSDFLSRCAFATIPAKRCDTLIDQSTTTHILEVEHTTEAELPENDFVKKKKKYHFYLKILFGIYPTNMKPNESNCQN